MNQQRTHYILSIDVEDYFQVEAFSSRISRADWDHWPARVVANTQRCLDLCDRAGVKSTCFVVGWVAEKFPALVREIQARGHELACHSFWHRTVYSLSPEAFREDLRMAKNAIEQASGVRVAGYRAPSWSITPKCTWALDILAEEGFLYDSSIYPIHHDLYGFPGARRFPYRIETAGSCSLAEYPPATVRITNLTLPCCGGGYLRIFPVWYTNWCLRRLERERAATLVVYFHPWEIDPEQPRISGAWKSRLRHYTRLDHMQERLLNLMSARPFVPFRDVLHAPLHTAAII